MTFEVGKEYINPNSFCRYKLLAKTSKNHLFFECIHSTNSKNIGHSYTILEKFCTFKEYKEPRRLKYKLVVLECNSPKEIGVYDNKIWMDRPIGYNNGYYTLLDFIEGEWVEDVK